MISIQYHQVKKKPLPVPLADDERIELEAIASKWGVSLAGAIRRLIREHKEKRSEKNHETL